MRFLPFGGLVALLYWRACQCQALYMDSGGGVHGDTAMPGIGTVPGLKALLLGWCAPEGLVFPWMANLFLVLAILCLMWRRFREARACSGLAVGLGLLTPWLLWHSSEHPLAHPLEGFYWWQASLITMLLAACLFTPAETKTRNLQAALVMAAIAALCYVPVHFWHRQRGIILHISGQIPVDQGTWVTFSLPGATCDHSPKQTVKVHKSVGADGAILFEEKLHVLGQPQTVQVSGPNLASQEFPLTVHDNIYSAEIRYKQSLAW